jgi:hypothetical protein
MVLLRAKTVAVWAETSLKQSPPSSIFLGVIVTFQFQICGQADSSTWQMATLGRTRIFIKLNPIDSELVWHWVQFASAGEMNEMVCGGRSEFTQYD